MIEKYVWLNSKEIKLMLQGTLHWIDISPRVTSSKAGMRKLGESPDKNLLPTQSENQVKFNLSKKKGFNWNRLEGKPVVWSLCSIGLLTLSLWFYFVLFSK